MWNWTEVAARTLINLGAVILGIVAAKELIDTGGDVIEAFRTGNEPPEPMDTHLFPPLA